MVKFTDILGDERMKTHGRSKRPQNCEKRKMGDARRVHASSLFPKIINKGQEAVLPVPKTKNEPGIGFIFYITKLYALYFT